jgi:ATP-dependent Clp protease ATP-binding subunit ClpC
MFANFNEEARKVLINSKKEMQELKHPYVSSEHLLLAILKEKNNVASKLKEYNLTYKNLKEEIINIIGIGKSESVWFLYTPLLRRVLENAVADSKENNNGEVTVDHLFTSILEEGEGVAIRIMLGMNINLDNLYEEFSYKFIGTNKVKKNKKTLLEELGTDLTKKALEGVLDPVVGRDEEIRRVLEILCRRTKNNPLLIGEAGVGKTAIVEELSRMIAIGEVPLALKNKRIISLDMATTVAGTKYRGEFEERMRKILKEIEESDDIILFIDEIHTLVGAGGAEGAIDASNIFKPALARNKIRCIGATTIDEYRKYIAEDGALERRFQKVVIEIPDKATVKDILIRLKEIYEMYHHVKIDEDIIDLIIDLSDRYIHDRNQPDKTIDILDEVCAKVSLKESKELTKYNSINKHLQKVMADKNKAIANNQFVEASNYKEIENSLMNELNNLELQLYGKSTLKIVTKEDVANVIHVKTKIPMYELLNDDINHINNMEKKLTDKIIGQSNAIKEIMNTAKRLKMGLKDDNHPYTILFTGSTGVGKTELAKIFGNELVGINNVIRLDMSEYTESHTVSKIIGAPPGYVGYKDNKNLLEEIRNKPYSVLILDEIEKANQNVINLFFQILDEGKIKDATNKIVHFDNVTIILTSNIGFNEESIGFNSNNKDSIINKLKEYFSLPFINRIDNIVLFNKLNDKDIRTLINKKIKKIKEKYEEKSIKLNINKKIVDELVKLSEYEQFGARKIDKVIKDKLESIVIDEIIKGYKIVNLKTIKESIVI